MINVNFFEKEKPNILPYIIGGIFLLLLLLMGLFFFIARGQLNKAIENNNNWLTENGEEVILSRQISQIDQLQNESLVVQDQLRGSQQPTNQLIEELVGVIPNETDRLSTLQLTETNQVMMILENIETSEGQEIVEDLRNLPFVIGVQFLYAENEASENDAFRYELTVDIDPTALVEEGQDEN